MFNNFTDTELANERWRDIDGYDGMYQVSSLGRVRSKKYGRWIVLIPLKHPKGYLQVRLYRNSKGKTVKIHRLVAQAFIPNDDESKTQINHRNEVKSDNRVSNLEYCDNQYNSTYNGLRKKQPHHQPVRDKIRHLYRPNLTDKENIYLFKEQGIECTRQTIWRLRKELGLIKN